MGRKKRARRAAAEIRTGVVLPALFICGALVNLALTTPNWQLNGFTQVALHAKEQANYSVDDSGLDFVPIDPDIVNDVLANQSNSGGTNEADVPQSTPRPGQSSTAAASTATPTQGTVGNPTQPSLPTVPIPTLPLPTLPLPTLPLPTLPLPTIDIPDVIDTVVPDELPILDEVLPEILPSLVCTIPLLCGN